MDPLQQSSTAAIPTSSFGFSLTKAQSRSYLDSLFSTAMPTEEFGEGFGDCWPRPPLSATSPARMASPLHQERGSMEIAPPLSSTETFFLPIPATLRGRL